MYTGTRMHKDGKLGSGRALPDLLFVTDERALGRSVRDRAAASKLLDRIDQQSRLPVLRVDATYRTAAEVALLVRERLAKTPGVKGVVLLGGYGVIPAQRMGCIPPGSRTEPADDVDHFIVWSDDVYGQTDDDPMPELPVSRVPDAGSVAFLASLLSASDAGGKGPAFGLRSKLRPFADEVYRRMSAKRMKISAPTKASDLRRVWKKSDRVYLMLHGLAEDPGRFLGEDEDDTVVDAVKIRNIPKLEGAVVFAACCWGALIVDTPAANARPGKRLRGRTPETSIALRALKNGAVAFVGSTGLHYSPTAKLPRARNPYGYLGQPLHDAFWAESQRGSSPARALFDAKMRYLKGIPHGLSGKGPSSDLHVALECKILRQFTCLGVGW